MPTPRPLASSLPQALVRALPTIAPSPSLGFHLRGVATRSFRQVFPARLYLHHHGDIRSNIPPANWRRRRPKRGLSPPTVTRHYHARCRCGQDAATSLQASDDGCWAVYKPVDPFCQLLVFPPNSPVHGHLVGRKGSGQA